MRIKFLILIILATLPALKLKAQVNCLNTLKEAKELYEAGLIDDIPKMLSGCMASGFTRVQRIEAYKLIIMAYLFDDNQFEAEKAMDEFLKKFPEYEVMPNDPVEFTFLLDSYKTSSVYSINFYVGPNYSNTRVLEPFTLMDQNNTTSDNIYERGIQFGIGVSRNISKGLNINIDCFYSSLFYSKTDKTNSPLSTSTNKLMTTLYSKENLKKVDFPLSLTYSFGKRNLSYYLRLGGMFSYITSSTIDIERTHPDKQPITGNLDIKDIRPEYYYAILGGAGFQYKVPRGYLILDLRYQYGLQNMSAGTDNYMNNALWSEFFYVDDKFNLDYMSINLGYFFTIYRSNRNRN